MNHYKAMDSYKNKFRQLVIHVFKSMRGNYWALNFDITWMSSTGHVCSDKDMERKI